MLDRKLIKLAGAMVAVFAVLAMPAAADAFMTQQAYVKASNTEASDGFGASAVSGDTLVVGAPGEDSNATGIDGNQAADTGAFNSGAVYVYTRTGTTWTQQAYIKASNTGGGALSGTSGDAFGSAVAISGDTLVVGAPGEDSNATGIGGTQSDNSAADSGAVYVFTRTGTTWSQQAYVKASNTGANDRFGAAVALSGDTLAVGAPPEDSNGIGGNQADNSAANSGATYVFTRTGTSWSQQAYVKASNTEAGDEFGTAVTLSGDTLAVGAFLEDSNATGIGGNQADNNAANSGAVYVFTRTGTTWSQQAYVKASNTGTGDFFGSSVALSGDTLAVGAPLEASQSTGTIGANRGLDDLTNFAGAVYVFTRTGTIWSQQAYVKASNTGPGDQFGTAVALSGDTLAVGAHEEDSDATGIGGNQSDDGAQDSGAAYVFTRAGTIWTQRAYVKASNTGTGDRFGRRVGVAGDTLVIGVAGEDSSATGINGNQADNSASGSGAAYVFVLDADQDSVHDSTDNCPNDANPAQGNHDGDAQGDACDADDDNDGVADGADACATGALGAGSDADGDGCKNSEDADDDNDTFNDGSDGCPQGDANWIPTTAADHDFDGCKDATEDPDDDNDGVADTSDNCALVANSNQANADGDAQGNPCDPDDDNDGIGDDGDNCPNANPGQENADGDALGDACDPDTPQPAPEEQCIVPKIKKGSSLKAVKRALRDAGCTLGKVNRVDSKKVARGKLIKLKAKAGSALPAGAAIGVVLSSGPR